MKDPPIWRVLFRLLIATYDGNVVPGFKCKHYATRKNAEAAARKFLATC